MKEQNDSKVPQVRFKGFEAEWDEELLGDIYTKIRNAFVGTATPYYTDKGHFYLQSNNVKNGEINRNTEVFINEYFYQSQKDKWLRANDIVMVQSGHVGHTAVIPDELDNTAAHALIIISRPSRDICSYFVNFYLQGNRAKRDLANITTGNTIKHILASEIKRFGVFCTHPTEQTKIGEYFRELDSLIGLHQRKHDKLLALKKAMLQKMFPQPGTTTPEIRFKGFSGKWTEKTLGDLMPITSAARVHKHEWTRSGVPFFRTSDVVSLYKGETNEKAFISFDLYEKLSDKIGRIKRGDILITGGGSIGIPFLVSSDDPLYFKDADLLWLKVPESIDSIYLYVFFSSDPFREYLGSISHIGTIGHYTVEQAKKTPITIPLQAEQKKIGSYFRTLDVLISQHATQLQKLQQIKSACLEKMFV